MRALIVGLGLLFLGACGFHLRGTNVGVAGVPVFTQIPEAWVELEDALTDGLKQADMIVAESPERAKVILYVKDVAISRRVQTVSNFGRAQDYELILRAKYQIGDVTSIAQSEIKTVDARREYNYANTDVLANSEEEALLIREMQRELVSRFLRQISFHANQAP